MEQEQVRRNYYMSYRSNGTRDIPIIVSDTLGDCVERTYKYLKSWDKVPFDIVFGNKKDAATIIKVEF